jgi:hypothetical protein
LNVLYSLTAFSLAGPLDTSLGVAATDGSIINIVRVVDASPPLDAVLGSVAGQPPVSGPGCPTGCVPPTNVVVTSGPRGLVNTGTASASADAAAAGAAALALAVGVLGAQRRRRLER